VYFQNRSTMSIDGLDFIIMELNVRRTLY